jgi:predicted Zn-dependent peptidase
MSVEVTRLPFGPTVVTHRMDHLKSAALGIWVDSGSRSEALAEHGIAHLLEHMAFKGTARRSAIAIAEEIEAVGGELNAATSVENTQYYARVLKEDVPLAMDILTDILRNSTFDPDELRREQHVIVQEIGAALDTPEDLVYDFFSAAAFPNQAIGRPILGTEESVRSMTRQSLFDYLGRNYRGPSLVVAAAGAIDHDALVEMAAKGLAGVGADRPTAPDKALYHGGDHREVRDLMEAQIVLGFGGRAITSPDYYAAQILATAVGGGMSSRLFQEVREKRGLCYSIYAFHWAFADGGIFGIHAATGEGDVAELMPVVLGEIERAAVDLSEEEIDRAKAQARAGLLMALESPIARAGQLARQMIVFGRVIPVDELVEKINTVTVADVRRLAEGIFTGTTPTLAAIGPVRALIEHDRVTTRLGAPAAA